MKRLFLIASVLVGFALVIPSFAQAQAIYAIQYPVSASYTAGVSGVYKRSDTSQFGTRMGFSGTSPCQVVDTADRVLNGYWTFQFQELAGTTSTPVTGTTISVHFKTSDVDSAAAWSAATKNTIVNGINAYSGATMVGYDINAITGVTPFRYFRIEYESGVSASTPGNGNLVPIGVLFVR